MLHHQLYPAIELVSDYIYIYIFVHISIFELVADVGIHKVPTAQPHKWPTWKQRSLQSSQVDMQIPLIHLMTVDMLGNCTAVCFDCFGFDFSMNICAYLIFNI